MKNKMYSLLASAMLGSTLIACTQPAVAPAEVSTTEIVLPDTAIKKDFLEKVNGAIFEVVYPRLEDEQVKYDRPLPVDKLPYSVRTDKFNSIGTAFATAPNHFVTACHVLQVFSQADHSKILVRDINGKTYRIGKILKISNYRDIVEFELADKIPTHPSLEMATERKVGDPVYVVGNALGAGISFRGGQLSSFTPEEVDGKWKNLRFSAPASPGNSGGPLMTAEGKVLGVVTRKSTSENLNYAVPIGELDNLSESQTEFYVKNSEVRYADRIESADWHYSSALPADLSAISLEIQNSFLEFRKTLYGKIFDSKDPRFFAATSAFQEFLRHQGTHTQIGFVSHYESGPPWGINRPKSESVQVDRHEYVSVIAGKNQYDFVSVDRPHGMPLAKFIKDPQVILDRVLKAVRIQRMFAGDKVRITSMGRPEKTQNSKDIFGRQWSKSFWNLRGLDAIAELDCTPTPKGAECAFFYYPSAVSVAAPDFFEQNGRNLIIISYVGTLAQWQDFLSLSSEWAPSVLKGMKFKWKEHESLSYDIPPFQAEVKVANVTSESELQLYMGLSPNVKAPKIDAQIIGVEVRPKNAKEAYFDVNIHFEPTGDASKKLQEAWQEILTGTGNYDGKPHTEDNWSRIRTTIIPKTDPPDGKVKAVATVVCGHHSSVTPKDLDEDCQAFRNNVKFTY